MIPADGTVCYCECCHVVPSFVIIKIGKNQNLDHLEGATGKVHDEEDEEPLFYWDTASFLVFDTIPQNPANNYHQNNIECKLCLDLLDLFVCYLRPHGKKIHFHAKRVV